MANELNKMKKMITVLMKDRTFSCRDHFPLTLFLKDFKAACDARSIF